MKEGEGKMAKMESRGEKIRPELDQDDHLPRSDGD
jgi:hypothetical protein